MVSTSPPPVGFDPSCRTICAAASDLLLALAFRSRVILTFMLKAPYSGLMTQIIGRFLTTSWEMPSPSEGLRMLVQTGFDGARQTVPVPWDRQFFFAASESETPHRPFPPSSRPRPSRY